MRLVDLLPGVLISTTSANEDALKVRPPLICQDEHADQFLAVLRTALTKLGAKP